MKWPLLVTQNMVFMMGLGAAAFPVTTEEEPFLSAVQ